MASGHDGTASALGWPRQAADSPKPAQTPTMPTPTVNPNLARVLDSLGNGATDLFLPAGLYHARKGSSVSATRADLDYSVKASSSRTKAAHKERRLIDELADTNETCHLPTRSNAERNDKQRTSA